MDKDRFETRSSTEPCRSLHVLGRSSRVEEIRTDRSLTCGKIGLGVAAIALLGCCVIGLVVSWKTTNIIQQQSSQREHIKTLADELSSLKQTDLILFPDGRIWYVRAVRGRTMEVVGWVGDNVRSENVDSFVLKEDNLTIVRHQDPSWPTQRDRFLEQ